MTILDLLRRFESRNITFMEPDGSWPIIWDRARGIHVWDIEGRRYVDLTAAFGVAAAGHANPRVVRAGQRQMSRLLHAMGDVHPHALKAQLARELSRITFERWHTSGEPNLRNSASNSASNSQPVWGKVIFCNSGFEAVEAALKSALLATGKPGVIAFRGAYHGLGYGALNPTHRDYFRQPFLAQLRPFTSFVDFPVTDADLPGVERALGSCFQTRRRIGAIIVEPVQVRGGIHIPPPEFLPLLRRVCDAHDALLILDEIYTGFGRTGRWFACEHWKVVPDIICLGKALTGGFPLSACVGRAGLMDRAWPTSPGEAIHTSTFLGHPVGCAMALAQMREIRDRGLVDRAAVVGAFLLEQLRTLRPPPGFHLAARGIGLLAGLEIRRSPYRPATQMVLHLVKSMLKRGFIVLPEGATGDVLAFTPPLTITRTQLSQAMTVLEDLLRLS